MSNFFAIIFASQVCVLGLFCYQNSCILVHSESARQTKISLVSSEVRMGEPRRYHH